MSSPDFISSVWNSWTDRKLNEKERLLVETCLTLTIDHGSEPPSAHVARVVASCGKPLADSVAAGLLTFGPRHGNAGSLAAGWLRDALLSKKAAAEVVTSSQERGERLAGIGHPVYEIDPRTTELFALAKETFGSTPHCDFISQVAEELSKVKGKKMPVNVDGAIAAIICEMGVPSELADALFILARTAGLIKQSREEAAQSMTYRRG